MFLLLYEIHGLQAIILLCVSTFLNLFLVYLIWRHTKSNLGTYKQLLTYLSLYNIFYSLCLFIVNPVIHTSGEHHYFVLFTDSYIASLFSRQTRNYLSDGICSIYGGAFMLLKIHFVYRYVQICKPKYVFLFERLRWKLFWIVYQFSQMTIWFSTTVWLLIESDEKTELFRQTLPKEYGLNYDDFGYCGIVYRMVRNGTTVTSWEDFYGVAFFLSISGYNLTCMLICGFLTYRGLQTEGMSAKTRKLQSQLFNSLVVLTILPVIFVYTPELLVVVGPAVGIGLESLGMVTMLMIAMMPAIDPIVLMYFIGDYRRAVRSIWCKHIQRRATISQYQENDTTQRQRASTTSNNISLKN